MTTSSLHAGNLTLSTHDEVPSHSPRKASLAGAPSTAPPASMVDRRRLHPSRRALLLTGDERIAAPPLGLRSRRLEVFEQEPLPEPLNGDQNDQTPAPN